VRFAASEQRALRAYPEPGDATEPRHPHPRSPPFRPRPPLPLRSAMLRPLNAGCSSSNGVRHHEHPEVRAGVPHAGRALHQPLFALLDHVGGPHHLALHAHNHRLYVF